MQMRVSRLALLLSALWIWTAEAAAERRVALLVGNSDYASVTPLANPKNDAAALAEKFEAIGFDKVTLKLDLNATEMRQALGQFARDAAGSDIAVIYFAGHGIEVGGTNYIIPTDAKLAHVDDVEFEALELAFWNTVKDRGSKRLIGLYLTRYPSGTFAALAKALLEELNEAALQTGRAQREQAEERRKEAEPAVQERASAFLFSALKKKFALSVNKLTNNASSWRPEFWRGLQRRLKNAGVYDGPLNGRFGPATREAIEALARRS